MKISRDQHNHLLLGQNYDIDLLKLVSNEIIKKFNGKIISKLNEIDTAYWDMSIDGILITLHYEHYLGVSIMPKRFFEKDKLHLESTIETESALIKKIEEHFSEHFNHIQTN